MTIGNGGSTLIERRTRREFLKATAAAAIGVGLVPAVARAVEAGGGRRRLIGIQCNAFPFRGEGPERVLDIVQERGRVNAVFLESYSHPKRPGAVRSQRVSPGHGSPEVEDELGGGMFTALRSEFYRGVPIGPEHFRSSGYDVFEDVVPRAHRRGIEVHGMLEDSFWKDIGGFDGLRERDWQGRAQRTFCELNPGYRSFVGARVRDLCTSYPLDGFMWLSERQGPLHNAIGASHAGGDPGRVTCFCEHHQRAARERGIDVKRAKTGFAELEKFVTAARSGRIPRDGAFVTFWRLLMDYPELLAWEKLWMDGKRGLEAEIVRTAKDARPSVKVGFHVWHAISFSPFSRAGQDLGEMARYADYVKLVAYNNSGGPRFVNYIDNIGGTIFADVPKDELLRFHYHLLGYSEKEAGYGNVAMTGLSSDYVARETRRGKAAVEGTSCRLFTGIDVDVPTDAGQKRAAPGDIRASTAAALGAGADGILFCRKYSEMRLENLAAGGEVVSAD